MNDLTTRLVYETVQSVPINFSRNNGEKFAEVVIQNYNLHMTAEYLVPLLQRAYIHWQHYHPERFEYDDEGNFWPKYYDDELVFSVICQRVLQRRIERIPELQLNDWHDLPTQMVDPNVRQVHEHYPQEFEKALAFQRDRAANFKKLCKFLKTGFGKSIPVENIACAVIQEIKQNPVLGLPLFG
jgi:hypothetical protein